MLDLKNWFLKVFSPIKQMDEKKVVHQPLTSQSTNHYSSEERKDLFTFESLEEIPITNASPSK